MFYSIPWGKVPVNALKYGFCKGALLNDPINFLEKENRAQVYTKTYNNKDEIDESILSSYIVQSTQL